MYKTKGGKNVQISVVYGIRDPPYLQKVWQMIFTIGVAQLVEQSKSVDRHQKRMGQALAMQGFPVHCATCCGFESRPRCPFPRLKFAINNLTEVFHAGTAAMVRGKNL